MRKSIIIRMSYTIMTVLTIVTLWAVQKECATGDSRYFSESTDEAESKYLEELKGILTQAGLYNCGITMTKVTQDGESFIYKVDVYAPSTVNMNEKERERLDESIHAYTPAVANCVVECNVFAR